MRTVLILGATSDMGAAIARKFAAEKYDVQLTARNSELIVPLQKDLEIRYGISCSIHSFDATDFKNHESFYNGLTTKPEVVICVFGYMNDNEKVIQNQSEIFQTINVNFTGAVSILNIISQDFANQKSGTIAGISSVAGERGRQSNYIYGSAKAGFTAYLSGLRNSMFHHNVHVATILPGFVYTKMTEHLQLPKLLTANPADVADKVYLATINKSNVVYVKWFWRWIMCIIRNIPESIFKKQKL